MGGVITVVMGGATVGGVITVVFGGSTVGGVITVVLGGSTGWSNHCSIGRVNCG